MFCNQFDLIDLSWAQVTGCVDAGVVLPDTEGSEGKGNFPRRILLLTMREARFLTSSTGSVFGSFSRSEGDTVEGVGDAMRTIIAGYSASAPEAAHIALEYASLAGTAVVMQNGAMRMCLSPDVVFPVQCAD